MIEVRGQDFWGCGFYGAPRGERTHSGVDLICHAGEAIVAFESGKVTKVGYPYNPSDHKKGMFRYVEITVDDNNRHRYFYCAPLVDVGDEIERGQVIGANQDLERVYPGIEQHLHFEVKTPEHKFIDPVEVLEELGYVVDRTD